MTPQMIRALGRRVFRGQEQRPIVGGPLKAVHALGGVRKRLSRAQGFDLQGVLAEADEINGVGEEALVVADNESAESDKLLAFAEFVQVQQHLFGSVEASLLPALDGVLPSLLRP